MTVAFIPVRGGSKSIPKKNIKMINGQPLIYWTLKAASDCQGIDRVYLSTDSKEIADVAENLAIDKVVVIGRDPETATDTASTESAMLDFANKIDFDTIILIQATSPLLETKDLEGGLALYHSESTDSVFSAVRQKRFHWAVDGVTGLASPTNYDYRNRPRRQNFPGYLVENGAFYITSKKRLVEQGNRMSGQIRIWEMPEESYFEIDEPSDWLIIEKLLSRRTASTVIPDIKMFLTDCDGCLTDAGMYYSAEGDTLKKFNTKDGLGMSRLRASGIKVGIVTGEASDIVIRRAEKLKLDIVLTGVSDKLKEVKHLCSVHGITLDQVAYVGDDLNDLDVIRACGYGCAVADAWPEVIDAAKYVTSRKGGDGAVREVAERILSGRVSP